MNKNNAFSIKFPLLLGCLFIFFSFSYVSATSPYDHCYQEAMRGEMGNFAEREARTACREQFPDIESKGVALPAAAIKKLQIDAGFGWGIFNGRIYNGTDYRVTQLTLRMTPIHDHSMEMMSMTSHQAKEYTIDLNLPPSSKGALSLAINADDAHIHDFQWEILQVLGHKTQ
ncbi:MAG: hypothetical protein Q8K59_05595 [Nitrosomonas sp.]|nr:hypothetical protein [Nitrosomonas sp.]MDP1950556.1 hypothetical protein [Nitrosomonas sp.]